MQNSPYPLKVAVEPNDVTNIPPITAPQPRPYIFSSLNDLSNFCLTHLIHGESPAKHLELKTVTLEECCG